MSNNLITLPGKILSNSVYGTEHLPILIKEYDLYKVNEFQNNHDGDLFFINVIPTSDNIFDTWSIEYKLYITTPDNDLLQGYYECNISTAGSNLTSKIFNGFGSSNSQEFPIESHLIMRYIDSEKYQDRNNYPIKIGISVGDNLERLYKVEIYSTYGCSAVISDNIETYEDVWDSSAYDSIDVINAKTNSIDYSDLNGIPTNISTFNNDAGYLTQHQDISGKADKVSNATNGNFAGLDSNGNLVDSGYSSSSFITQHQSIPEYTVEKLASSESGYSSSYVLKKNNIQVGATINIPKDMVVSNGEIRTANTIDVPYQGAQVGDKYIELTIANTEQNKIYIPVKDLVDVYTEGNGININSSNVVSIKIDQLNSNGLSVGENGLSLSTVTTTSSGVMSSADKSKLDGIASGAEVNIQSDWNQTNTSADDYIKNKPNIGSLKTDNTTAQTPSASESFTGDVSLHKIAKTGSYNDLNDKPTIPSSGDFVTSLGTSGNNVTWTKNGVTNNLTVPYATNAGTAAKLGSSTVGGSTTRPIYLNAGSPTAITSMAMRYFGWPVDGYTALDSVSNLYLNAGANVCAHIKPDYVDVEYTNDNGVTWLDYGATDEQKVKIFTTSGGFSVGKKSTSSSTNVTVNDAVRITVHAGAGFYCHSLFMMFRFYCPATCRLKVEYTTYSATTTWTESGTYTFSGNPTYLMIPFDKYIFGNNGVHDFRLTLQYAGTGYVTNGHTISMIKIFSNNIYSGNSTLATTGRLYSYDWEENATFPANVTASKFIKSGGTSSQFLKADGTVDTNTYLTQHQDISGKADKASTLAGYGITDAKIENGVITLGSNTITPLTSHQSLTNYVQKSNTSGLLKNDGTQEIIDVKGYKTKEYTAKKKVFEDKFNLTIKEI